jgi:hypothetical protein
MLLLFPFEFRREYGAEMADVFDAQRADAARAGRAATIRLWLSTWGGFLRAAPGQHAAMLRQDLTST